MHYNFDKVIDRKGTFSVKWAEIEGRDIIPMGLADMEFQSDVKIIKALENRVKHGVFGYTLCPQSFFESISSWFSKRHKWNIKKEWISVNQGVVSSLHIAIRAFSNPGNKVIIQTPVYYPFYLIIESNGRVISENKLIYDNNQYRINFEEIEKLLKEAKILVLCNPHNPVGRVWNKEELLRLGKLCLENNVLIISDDIHCDFTFDSVYFPLTSF
jgi:cystathionine beta-lyase